MEEENNDQIPKINDIQNRKTIEKINGNKRLFFDQINKTGKSLARLAKKKIFKDSNYQNQK